MCSSLVQKANSSFSPLIRYARIWTIVAVLRKKHHLWGGCSEKLSAWLDTISENETKAIAPDTRKPNNLRWTYNMQKKTQSREERENEEEAWRVTCIKKIRRMLKPYPYSHEAENAKPDK